MKDKEIEQMARIIDDRLIEANGVFGSMNNGKGYWIAQKLIEYYQPKIPEDSVVLKDYEYLKLCRLAGDTQMEVQKARKETAEKILKDIMFCIDINDCNKNEMLILNLCKMLAKQFGVGVEK